MGKEFSLFEGMVQAAQEVVSFALLGGECDEYARFLQLEWESYEDESEKNRFADKFYSYLEDYKKYRAEKRDWRKDFGSRDFTKLIV